MADIKYYANWVSKLYGFFFWRMMKFLFLAHFMNTPVLLQPFVITGYLLVLINLKIINDIFLIIIEVLILLNSVVRSLNMLCLPTVKIGTNVQNLIKNL